MRKAVCSEKYSVRLEGHAFVPSKFERAARLLAEEGFAEIIEPPVPSRDDLLLAHSPEWADKLLSMSLSAEDLRLAELPVTRAVADAHILHCGGTILACRLALEDGAGLHAGGGSHHAFRERGTGFCLLNDIAVGINKMRAEKLIRRAIVIDLDAHQGDGTASIFERDADVFTFSMHGRLLFPEQKGKSSLDVELEPGTDGPRYMAGLERVLPGLLADFRPELAVYLAGADVYERDRLGGFCLSMDDIRRRDEYVARQCAALRVPLAVVLGGGYAADPEDTARIHAATLRSVAQAYNC